MWSLLSACAGPGVDPVPMPRPLDPPAASAVAASSRYLALARPRGPDGPPALLGALSDAGTRVRAGDPEARALLSVWLLDAEIRRASLDRRALRDLLVAVGPEVDGPEWHRVATEVAGAPLEAWAVQDGGDGPLDYGAALDWFGLAWTDAPDGTRSLRPNPGASGIARRHRARWSER